MANDRRRLESLADSPEPDQKRCSSCGAWKPLGDFYLRKHRTKFGGVSVFPHSECRACEIARHRRYKERKKAEGVWEEMRARHEANLDKEKRRIRERERKAAKRREEGAPIRRQTPALIESKHAGYPAAPLAAFLREEVDARTLPAVAAAVGMAQRQITGLLRCEHETITLATIDKILTGLGCPEEIHFLYPAEEESLPAYRYLVPDSLQGEAAA